MENTFLLSTIPEDKIKLDVEDKFQKFSLQNYKPSVTQVIFFRKILESLAQQNTPVILFRPILSRQFREKLSGYDIENISQDLVHENIERTKEKFPHFRFVYFEPEFDLRMKCRKFMDATHLSASCSGELISLLKQQL
jgi:hypothetical protein